MTLASKTRTYTLGSVSYLNARPLIYGLDREHDLSLKLDVPAKLLKGLRDRSFDLALLPIIDYQRLDDLVLVPSGGIGCDGATLTVRIFSPRPIDQIRTLASDPDSHTSVALARIILRERFGIDAQFVDLFKSDGGPNEARLLIGDKVVCEEPAGFEHQLDLGEEWKLLTGMPFVFAAWIAHSGVDLSDVPERLLQAKRAGLSNVHEIVDRFAIPRGWPGGIALQYLTHYLRYDIGEAQLDAIRLFHQKAAEHGIIHTPPAPLRLYAQT